MDVWDAVPTFPLLIRLDESVLRGRVQEAEGPWDPRRKVWVLTYGAVCALVWEDRMVTPLER